MGKRARGCLAIAFLIVLLAEWGSHAVICSEEFHTANAQSISATHTGHEDPCQTLVLCRDNKQKDQRMPNLGHDASQHNGLVDVFAALIPKLSAVDESQIGFHRAVRLFRPPKPPFHPPKQA